VVSAPRSSGFRLAYVTLTVEIRGVTKFPGPKHVKTAEGDDDAQKTNMLMGGANTVPRMPFLHGAMGRAAGYLSSVIYITRVREMRSWYIA
jgi:hypothetical protein